MVHPFAVFFVPIICVAPTLAWNSNTLERRASSNSDTPGLNANAPPFHPGNANAPASQPDNVYQHFPDNDGRSPFGPVSDTHGHGVGHVGGHFPNPGVISLASGHGHSGPGVGDSSRESSYELFPSSPHGRRPLLDVDAVHEAVVSRNHGLTSGPSPGVAHGSELFGGHNSPGVGSHHDSAATPGGTYSHELHRHQLLGAHYQEIAHQHAAAHHQAAVAQHQEFINAIAGAHQAAARGITGPQSNSRRRRNLARGWQGRRRGGLGRGGSAGGSSRRDSSGAA